MTELKQKYIYIAVSGELQNLADARFNKRHVFKFGISSCWSGPGGLLTRLNVGFRGVDGPRGDLDDTAPLAGCCDWGLVAKVPEIEVPKCTVPSETWLIAELQEELPFPEIYPVAEARMLAMQREIWPNRGYVRTNGFTELCLVDPARLEMVQKSAWFVGYPDACDLIGALRSWFRERGLP